MRNARQIGVSGLGPGSRVRIGIFILALVISLATRTFPGSIPRGVTVKSGVVQAMRQHMNRDAVQWVSPAPVFALLQASEVLLYVPPANPSPSVVLNEKLYNRPPPSR